MRLAGEAMAVTSFAAVASGVAGVIDPDTGLPVNGQNLAAGGTSVPVSLDQRDNDTPALLAVGLVIEPPILARRLSNEEGAEK
ncbi:hypothetical protein [Amycolatopsis jejuensis]|uniref:hypothetical protein n=1 Tax=Amycolatopsis jejuensis TaxID=330084 RepID=UPI0005243FC9|nr:hypothetical protein [Amycolatopsis jejuensis]